MQGIGSSLLRIHKQGKKPVDARDSSVLHYTVRYAGITQFVYPGPPAGSSHFLRWFFKFSPSHFLPFLI